MRAFPPASDAERASVPSSTAGAGVGGAATPPTVGAGEPSPHPGESALVAALGRGEPWAAEEVWARHAASVRRLMTRALGRRPEVEDLTQEAFMRVFSRIGLLRDAGALREFVFAIAVNVLKRELRYRWVRRRVLLSDSGSVPDVEGPRSDPEAREALGRCYAILDKLGTRERAAFVLRYMEERTLDEVATGLGVSLSTAKRLVTRSAERVSKHVGSDHGLRSFFDQRQSAAAPPRTAGADSPSNASAKANVSR
jgi:RNA polymerase sigma-70 factor (ECF subfamily)